MTVFVVLVAVATPVTAGILILSLPLGAWLTDREGTE